MKTWRSRQVWAVESASGSGGDSCHSLRSIAKNEMTVSRFVPSGSPVADISRCELPNWFIGRTDVISGVAPTWCRAALSGRMARPRNQHARRAEIVDAATSAIAARGLMGLRIKDVADAASLSPGSITYYFPGIDELLLAVHEAAVTRFFEARRTAATDVDDPVEALSRLVELGICDPDDPMSPALYELHLYSARSPAHAELMSTLFDLETSLYREAIDGGIAAGVFADVDSERVARAAVALEDGCGIHLVGRTRALDAASARSAVMQYLQAALRCPDLVVEESPR